MNPRLNAVPRPTLLTPPENAALRKRPPRAVYRSAFLECTVLVVFAGVLYFAARLFPVATGNTSRLALGTGIALLPLGLWFVVSYRGERRTGFPRKRLILVVGLTALAANGIGVPLVNRIFEVDEWLATTSGLQRVIGYALTAGFTQEFIKLAVVRFTVWENDIRTRRDGIAYSLAASVGYATVLSLAYVLTDTANAPDVAAVALRVAGFALSQMAIGTICGYALADLRIGRPAVLWLPLGLAIAALMEGVFVALRAGVIVSSIGTNAAGVQTSNGSQLISSLAVAAGLLVILFAATNFMINSTDARERRSPEFHR